MLSQSDFCDLMDWSPGLLSWWGLSSVILQWPRASPDFENSRDRIQIFYIVCRSTTIMLKLLEYTYNLKIKSRWKNELFTEGNKNDVSLMFIKNEEEGGLLLLLFKIKYSLFGLRLHLCLPACISNKHLMPINSLLAYCSTSCWILFWWQKNLIY